MILMADSAKPRTKPSNRYEKVIKMGGKYHASGTRKSVSSCSTALTVVPVRSTSFLHGKLSSSNLIPKWCELHVFLWCTARCSSGNVLPPKRTALWTNCHLVRCWKVQNRENDPASCFQFRKWLFLLECNASHLSLWKAFPISGIRVDFQNVRLLLRLAACLSAVAYMS